jgi:isopentenyldiphosphate isomerase
VFLARAETDPVPNPREVAAVDWWRWVDFVGAALAAESPISPWAQEQVRQLHAGGHVARFLTDLTQDQSTCNR